VQNSPLQSAVVRNNFQATYNDLVSVAGLIGGGVSSINGAQGGFTFTGSGVSCASTTCTFTGGASGVSSIAGTAGQITASASTGAVTLSLPSTLTQNTTYSGTANFTSTFSISGVAETFPGSGLIVGTTDTQTLTNKSIDGSEINSGTVLAARLPTGTAAAKGILQGDGSTLTITAGVIACTTGTTSQLGCLEPDGTTITVSSGVISAVTGGSGNVTGPASSTTNAIATYADTTGKLLANNTGVTIASNVVTDSQAISATSTDGYVLSNPTTATVGAQKWSPRLRLTGSGWKTASTAAGQTVDWVIENQPVQGSTNPTTNLVISDQVNAAGYNAALTLLSGGGLNLASGNYQIGGTQIACANLSNGAASCSTDTTNASNISTGTLAAARGGAGTISGALKGNGSGVVSQAACADLSNGATGCSTATGTSGATIPLLNGANTWSGNQTLSAVNLITDTTTGMKIGTSTSQKLGFFNATPIVQPTGDIITAMQNLGLGASLTIGTSDLPSNQTIRSIQFVIDGGGSTITTGVKGFLVIPFACTINSVTMLGDQSGSIVVDIWKKAFTTTLPTVANTITASDIPTISSAVTVQDTTLTGWTTSVSANDMIGFNVNSVTTMQRVTVALKCTAT
jgi:hypothetical protein